MSQTYGTSISGDVASAHPANVGPTEIGSGWLLQRSFAGDNKT